MLKCRLLFFFGGECGAAAHPGMGTAAQRRIIAILIHYTVETRQPGNGKAACTPKTKCRLLFHLIRMLFGSKSALSGCCKNRCNTASSAGFCRPVCHSPMK